jgi:hypothetical protein
MRQRLYDHLQQSTLAIFAVIWLLGAQTASASTCPPPVHLLFEGQTQRLVADVTVIGTVPASVEWRGGSIVVKVNTVYSGFAPGSIVIESPEGFLDCEYDLADIPTGTRLLMGVQHDYPSGRYGGGRWGSVYTLSIQDESVEGYLVRPDCPSNHTACLYGSFQSMTLEEFAEVARSYAPDQYDEREVLEAFSESIGQIVRLRDGRVTTGSELALEFETFDCYSVVPNAVDINSEDKLLRVSYGWRTPGSITPTPPCNDSELQAWGIGRVYQPGDYLIRLYEESANQTGGFFQASNHIGSLEIVVADPSDQYAAETPADGATVSGIGLIRGWACDARSVSVQFDNLPPIEMAYGATRLDTLPVCGDANNGYGAVIAWGSLGEGSHTMKTFIDGGNVSTVEFEVTGLGEPFVEGLSAEYDLEGFPAPGDSVRVRWSEADQNFIIVGRP